MIEKILIMTHTDLDGYGSGAILFNALMGNFIRDYTEGQIFASGEEDFGFYKKITVIPPKNIHNYIDVPRDIIHMLYNYQTEEKYAELLQQAVQEGRKIFILDISITEETAKGIFSCLFADGVDLTWIDHHQSSVEFANSELGSQLRYKGIIDTRSSAALLTYEYLYDKRLIRDSFISNDNLIEDIAKDIDDHDRWIHEMNGEALNEHFYNGTYSSSMHSICSFDWFNFMTNSYDYENMLAEGKLLVRHTQSMYNRIYESTKQDFFIRFFVIDSKPNTYSDGSIDKENIVYYTSYVATMLMATCNGVGNSSLFGEDDTNHNTKDLLFRYSSCWENGNHAWRGTFYSCNESHVNCNKVAESFGGGGHKHAAGCTIRNLRDINDQNINVPNVDGVYTLKKSWIINSGLSDILRNTDVWYDKEKTWDKIVGNTPVLRLFIFANEAEELFGGKNFKSVTDNPICGINPVVGCDCAEVIVPNEDEYKNDHTLIINDITRTIDDNLRYPHYESEISTLYHNQVKL